MVHIAYEGVRLQINGTVSAYCTHCQLPLSLPMKYHTFLTVHILNFEQASRDA
jgi:hypothetical protein